LRVDDIAIGNLAQLPFVIIAVLMVVTIGFRLFGTGLLANWLGLTHEKASRMSSLMILGMWAALFFLVTTGRAGILSAGSPISAIADGILGQNWWIFAIIGVTLVWKFLR
jgi:hypothetical protein